MKIACRGAQTKWHKKNRGGAKIKSGGARSKSMKQVWQGCKVSKYQRVLVDKIKTGVRDKGKKGCTE